MFCPYFVLANFKLLFHILNYFQIPANHRNPCSNFQSRHNNVPALHFRHDDNFPSSSSSALCPLHYFQALEIITSIKQLEPITFKCTSASFFTNKAHYFFMCSNFLFSLFNFPSKRSSVFRHEKIHLIQLDPFYSNSALF